MAQGARILALGAGLLAAATPARAQSSFADATSMTWDGVLTGIFLGLLLFSLAYNAVFYRLLRERFLIWQSVRALSHFALAVALSPLAMGAWLAPDSFARQVWITIQRPGVFYGQCSELCGANHAFMPIGVRVVSQAQFDLWWKTLLVGTIDDANATLPAL